MLEFYLVFNTLGIRTEPNYKKCENQRANFGLILEPRPFDLVSIPHDFGFRGQFQVGPRYLNPERLGPTQQFKYPPNIGHDLVLFWFSLQGGCEGSKVVLFFSIARVGHEDKTLDVNFCFDLVCKVVVEVQRRFILFTYMYKKLKLFFPPNVINHFHEFIVFLSYQFVEDCQPTY